MDSVEIRREQPATGPRPRSQERQPKCSAALGMEAGLLLIVKMGRYMSERYCIQRRQ